MKIALYRVARCSASISVSAARSHHIIEQTELSQVWDLRQVEAEKIVRKGTCDKVQELDLIANLETRVGIFHLSMRQMCRFQ